jgi:hypothetical protein
VDLAAIMDALAGAVPAGLVTRAYGHPVGSVVPPAAVVGYPTEFEYDSVFLRGSDRVVFPVYFVCGMADDKSARDEVSLVTGGTGEIKDAIETDATLLAEVQTVRVTGATFESVTIGAVPMIGVRFDVEVYT